MPPIHRGNPPPFQLRVDQSPPIQRGDQSPPPDTDFDDGAVYQEIHPFNDHHKLRQPGFNHHHGVLSALLVVVKVISPPPSIIQLPGF